MKAEQNGKYKSSLPEIFQLPVNLDDPSTIVMEVQRTKKDDSHLIKDIHKRKKRDAIQEHRQNKQTK